MKIAVGSTNPIKIRAVENIVTEFWEDAEIVSINSPSNINSQPMSDDEAIKGALNRAKYSLINTQSDFGVGLEGSVRIHYNDYFLTAWCAVTDKDEKVGLGSTGYILIPKIFTKELENGKELNDILDKFTNTKNIRHREGGVGLFTKGLVTRKSMLERAVAYAFARFINPELYTK